MLFHKKKETLKPVRLRIASGCIHCKVCEKVCRDIFVLTAKSINGRKVIHVSQDKLNELHQAEYRCPTAVIDIIEE